MGVMGEIWDERLLIFRPQEPVLVEVIAYFELYPPDYESKPYEGLRPLVIEKKISGLRMERITSGDGEFPPGGDRMTLTQKAFIAKIQPFWCEAYREAQKHLSEFTSFCPGWKVRIHFKSDSNNLPYFHNQYGFADFLTVSTA